MPKHSGTQHHLLQRRALVYFRRAKARSHGDRQDLLADELVRLLAHYYCGPVFCYVGNECQSIREPSTTYCSDAPWCTFDVQKPEATATGKTFWQMNWCGCAVDCGGSSSIHLAEND